MTIKNPVFEQNYKGYLDRLDLSTVALKSAGLGVDMTKSGQMVHIPFFNNLYNVSKFGVTDCHGIRPDYSTCVILLKYLLMDPPYVSENREWIPFREFKDSGRGSDEGLSDYIVNRISTRYSGRVERLEQALGSLGCRTADEQYPYDLCAVIPALPKIPLLFLFNDEDEQLSAQAFILYERRAECFLDAECRVMVNWCLFEHLKKNEKDAAHQGC